TAAIVSSAAVARRPFANIFWVMAFSFWDGSVGSVSYPGPPPDDPADAPRRRASAPTPLDPQSPSQAAHGEDQHVVERVGPGGDSEPAQQEEDAECEPGKEAEDERPDRPLVTVGPDVVKARKSQRRKEGRQHSRPARGDAA